MSAFDFVGVLTVEFSVAVSAIHRVLGVFVERVAHPDADPAAEALAQDIIAESESKEGRSIAALDKGRREFYGRELEALLRERVEGEVNEEDDAKAREFLDDLA